MRMLLFENVHAMMRAEKIVGEAKIPYEVLPTPKKYSAECGMCLGIHEDYLEAAREHLGRLVCTVVEDEEGVE